jgi:hypothetical protein
MVRVQGNFDQRSAQRRKGLAMASNPTQGSLHRQSREALSELRRVQKFKTSHAEIATKIGQPLIEFFKQSVAKRQTKLSQIAECWTQIIPSTLSDHCSLESLSKGILTVIVDSSSHLYELKQLLLAGAQQQLLMTCKAAGLRKVTLKFGRWYEGDSAAEGRLNFSSGK